MSDAIKYFYLRYFSKKWAALILFDKMDNKDYKLIDNLSGRK